MVKFAVMESCRKDYADAFSLNEELVGQVGPGFYRVQSSSGTPVISHSDDRTAPSVSLVLESEKFGQVDQPVIVEDRSFRGIEVLSSECELDQNGPTELEQLRGCDSSANVGFLIVIRRLQPVYERQSMIY